MAPVVGDFERCYRAVQSRDARFDGWFFTGVTSTGIYCRPSCPARTPSPAHVRFFPTAAAAQRARFRACLRCRPDAVPGSPEWNVRADACARAMRLIADGVVDREGVPGLASRLGYGARHLHRLLVGEIGAGPLALARAQRAQTARILIETTDLPMAEVAFAAGFSSVRQFNETVRDTLGGTPSALRRHGRRAGVQPGAAAAAAGAGAGAGGASATTCARTSRCAGGTPVVTLRLPYRRPMATPEVLAFLGDRAVGGIEWCGAGSFARTLRLPHGHAAVVLSAASDHVAARLVLGDLSDLQAAVGRCRRLLDLDADPEAVDGALGADPALRPLVSAAPGRRVPGAVDGFELAVRAIVGQQVSLSGARTAARRLVYAAGRRLDLPPESLRRLCPEAGDADVALTHVFPAPAELLELDPAAWAMPAVRRRAVLAVAAAVERGEMAVDPGADRRELRVALQRVRGIGPWTAEYVAMRALGDPDAFLPTDLGILRAMRHLGRAGTPAAAAKAAERWRPWRSYAAAHLWAAPSGGPCPGRARRGAMAGAGPDAGGPTEETGTTEETGKNGAAA